MMLSAQIQYHSDVATALTEKRPVVALESTLIAHGLPYPENVEAAVGMETAVRQQGAVPATIAILKGRVHVGLTGNELEYIATRPQAEVARCSRHNLAFTLAQQQDGTTTVAGTMILAHLAGIEVFATGGIGGVHRGNALDVSADLIELGRTPVTVVCSGVKPFLDLAATQEVLETQGVSVIGYQTEDLAPFFSRPTECRLHLRVETPQAVAQVVQMNHALSMQSGNLVVVPLPAESRLERAAFDEVIEAALQEAEVQGVRGTAVTSWMVGYIARAFGAETLKTNVMLLRENAVIGAQIAAAVKRET